MNQCYIDTIERYFQTRMMHCHAVSIELSTCRTIFLLVSLFDIVLSTLTIESSSFLPSSSSSVRSYDTLYGDHFISDSYINADRLRQFGTNIANEQTLNNEDSALYSGPVFVFEPEQREQYPLKYNNVTSAAITCKVSGYPTPRIDWRVDNITIAFNNHGPLKDHETWSGQQLFVPLLNSIVTLRNDGQTLLVGGEANGTGLYQSSSFHSHHPFMSSSFASASLSSSTSGTSMSHQIECLATNQFGSIVSRPVFVQQQQQQQGKFHSFYIFLFVKLFFKNKISVCFILPILLIFFIKKYFNPIYINLKISYNRIAKSFCLVLSSGYFTQMKGNNLCFIVIFI